MDGWMNHQTLVLCLHTVSRSVTHSLNGCYTSWTHKFVAIAYSSSVVDSHKASRWNKSLTHSLTHLHHVHSNGHQQSRFSPSLFSVLCVEKTKQGITVEIGGAILEWDQSVHKLFAEYYPLLENNTITYCCRYGAQGRGIDRSRGEMQSARLIRNPDGGRGTIEAVHFERPP